MPIGIQKYVDITSGIGAASPVPQRDLGGLIVTGNPLVPTNTFVTFENADDVENYFGSNSEEFARAEFYFGWVSKDITSPGELSFWNWNNNAATGSRIYGAKNSSVAVADFTSITTGDFTLTMGGHTTHLTAIDLSGDASLAAVAASIQTVIRAQAGNGASWTGATVAFDATNSRFTLVSGATGIDTIAVTAGVVEDIAAPLGWIANAHGVPILSNGTAAQTVTAMLVALAEIDDNFGSFCFTYALALTLLNTEAAATWNNALDPNVRFIFSSAVTAANAAAWSAALINTGGVTLTLQGPSGEFHEMMPMAILAATDYSEVNSVQNYMFQIFDATATVVTDIDSDLYDSLRINYYGQTQTAGQLLQFYQRGVMMGLPVDPADQNVYANEIWFKDAIGAALMNLLLALARLPANSTGRAQILAVLQSVIQSGLDNGTVSVGKALNITQKLYIAQITGDSKAWLQVQNQGYWVGVKIVATVTNGITQYKATYTLIYSKDDVIRRIEGRDILI